jgi:hypothetical protein
MGSKEFEGIQKKAQKRKLGYKKEAVRENWRKKRGFL